MIINYLKPTDLLAPRFYGQPKIHKPSVPNCPVVSYAYNFSKGMVKIWKLKDQVKLKIKITTPRVLPHFPTRSEIFSLKTAR